MDTHNNIKDSNNTEVPQAPVLSNNQPTSSSPSIFSGEIKKYFIYVLVGGIIVSALISIGAILVGEFNDITAKALLSTISIVIHSMLALAFVGTRMGDSNPYVRFIINILFVLILVSLPTSLLSIWGALTPSLTAKLYGVYFLVFFASLYCLAIIKTKLQDNISIMAGNVSMGIAVIFSIYLMPLVLSDNRSDMGEFYYRVLAVLAILLGTSTVLSAIFHKLYLSKHPELKNKSKRTPAWVIVLLILAGLFILPYIVSLIFYGISQT